MTVRKTTIAKIQRLPDSLLPEVETFIDLLLSRSNGANEQSHSNSTENDYPADSYGAQMTQEEIQKYSPAVQEILRRPRLTPEKLAESLRTMDAIIGPNVPVLSDYAVSREGIYPASV